MSFFPLAQAKSSPAPVRHVLEETQQRWGFLPNIARALALRPEILDAEDHWTRAVMHTGLLPRPLKEAVATTVSAVNRCTYCATSHAYAATRTGAPKDLVDACSRLEFRSRPEKERVALEFAKKAARDMNAIAKRDAEGLLRHYSPAEIVELAMVIGSFMMYNTFVTVLGLELEPAQQSHRVDVGTKAAR